MKSLSLFNLFKMCCLIFSCLILVTSCITSNTSDYGKRYNFEREKRNIPIIPDNWSVRTENNINFWFNPDDYLNGFGGNPWGDGVDFQPKHFQKTVELYSENFVKETDGYLGKEVLEIKNEIVIRERIFITCFYSLSDIFDVQCTSTVYTKEVEIVDGDFSVGKSILEKWGIKYP